MTRPHDALLAARLGADAIGVVFTARSKRRVTLAQAQAIRDVLPPFVALTALFMDDSAEDVAAISQALEPDYLQFHGDESDEWCAQFGRSYLKAIAMGDGEAALARLQQYPRASALLLDGHGLGEAGGSGKRFDWSLFPRNLAQPVMLAGGLTAENVARAIRAAHPWAVDVASGVESAPGIKDAEKLAAFMGQVRLADG
ncbi:phosphoribosylanthranilate isomerase [Dyella sp.]|uniref:phosphoribosylanthranilate isomerase n=1 Tax=Dyella sp. TaxID=1869338 RepID=UPI002ED014FE